MEKENYTCCELSLVEILHRIEQPEDLWKELELIVLQFHGHHFGMIASDISWQLSCTKF